MLAELNPIVRGWGNYYRRAHVRRLFNRLNHWIVMRVWNHQHKHWRNAGWRHLPDRRLYGELGLVNLLQLIPSMESYYRQKGLVSRAVNSLKKFGERVEDLVGGLGPDERLGVLVPGGDPCADVLLERVD